MAITYRNFIHVGGLNMGLDEEAASYISGFQHLVDISFDDGDHAAFNERCLAVIRLVKTK